MAANGPIAEWLVSVSLVELTAVLEARLMGILAPKFPVTDRTESYSASRANTGIGPGHDHAACNHAAVGLRAAKTLASNTRVGSPG